MNEARYERGRITLSWVRVEGKSFTVAYDRRTNKVIEELMDYSIYISDHEQLNHATVENEVTFLKSFTEFLLSKNLNLMQIDDEILMTFRDEDFATTCRRIGSGARHRVVKGTVNAKLRRIYQYLYWLEHVEKRTSGAIGPNGRVQSGRESGTRSRGRARGGARRMFPLLFRNSGGASRHTTNYVATDRDISGLCELFLRKNDLFTAQRNILLMDIAEEVGWRRGSLSSLRCGQFNRDHIEAARDHFSVIPDTQKRGYANQFEISKALAFRIVEFIETIRNPMARLRGWSRTRTKDLVFVSAKDGTPMRTNSLSAIFGKAFKQLGAPKGAGLHSFRRKFANDQIREETELRVEGGLDTSVASIAAAVAIKMGHSSSESLYPYVSAAQSHRVRQDKVTLASTNARLERENRLLKSRVQCFEKGKGG